MHFLTLVKIKNRTTEVRLNPHLICLSMLEQTHVELTDEHMDAHGGTGGSCEFFAKFGFTLRCDVQRAMHCRAQRSKTLKNPLHAKSSKITIFRVGSCTTMLTLAKR